MAEFLFNDLVIKLNLSKQVISSSAATSTEEIGNPVYNPAKRELYKHGINCDGKYARQIAKSDYNKYDLIIAMDDRNIRNMKRVWTTDPGSKIKLLMDYTNTPKNVSDPWYTGNFEQTWADILEGCIGILRNLYSCGKISIDECYLSKNWREFYE